MKAMLLTVVAGLAAALAGCARPAPQPVAPIAVAVAPIRSGSYGATLSLAGTVAAIDAATIGADAAGRVVAVEVHVGDAVRAGQVLARLDARGYRARYAQAAGDASSAAAGVGMARAQLADAQAQMRLARVTAARMTTLYREGAIARQDEDRSAAALARAASTLQEERAALAAAQSQAAAASAGVQSAAVPLADATIRAPFAGVVSARYVAAGAVVAPGSPIAAIQNERRLEVEVAVPLDRAAGLTRGAHLRLRSGGRTYLGTITGIAPSDPMLRALNLRIAIGRAPGLVPGSYVRVSVPYRIAGATLVPSAALVTRAGQDGVFAVRAGRARFVPVQARPAGDGEIAIRGARALAGSMVAISALERLTDGAPVRVQPR